MRERSFCEYILLFLYLDFISAVREWKLQSSNCSQFHCDYSKKLCTYMIFLGVFFVLNLAFICVNISMFSLFILTINSWYRLYVLWVFGRTLVQESLYALFTVLCHHFLIVVKQKKFATEIYFICIECWVQQLKWKEEKGNIMLWFV